MNKYHTGGAVDTHIPARAIGMLKQHGITDPQFFEWLGAELGRYRDYAQVEPGIPEQVDDMRKLADLMMQVYSGLQLDAMPPAGEAYADKTMYDVHGELYFDVARRLEQDLLRASAVLDHAAGELSGYARRGPKNKSQRRNEILGALVDKLREAGATAAEARETARLILLECGIFGPGSERAVRRATSSLKK